MRHAALALLLILLLPFAVLTSSARPAGPTYAGIVNMDLPDGVVRVTGELLVGMDGAAKRSSLALVEGVELLDSPALERIGVARVRVASGADEAATVARLALAPGVRFVEPNIFIQPASVPSDPLYGGVNGESTDLQKWVFGGVAENTVLNAEAAWDVTMGDPAVVIAVLDSGLDVDNPDFQRLWTNARETPGNGVDDDGNGYIDDVHGYDFHNRRGDITPDYGDGEDNDFNGSSDDSAPHGTAAASIINAAHDGAGMAGGAPGCSLMTVKIFGDDGGVTVSDLVEAIEYAADNGADVMNLSLSTLFKNEALGIGVRYAIDKGVVMVAAAGNGNAPVQQYPASFGNVVAVGGSGSGFSITATSGQSNLGKINGRWPKSQYGFAAVSVVAPAVTLAANFVTVAMANADPELTVGSTTFEIVEGTSFATPYVSALAGLVIARDRAVNGRRTLDAVDIRQLLINTANDLPTDFSDNRPSGPGWDGFGRVDYLKAVLEVPGSADPTPSIERATYGKKTLRIYGTGFSMNSQIEINGVVLPIAQVFTYASGSVEVKGTRKALGLKKRDPNAIVVIERGVRSNALAF